MRSMLFALILLQRFSYLRIHCIVRYTVYRAIHRLFDTLYRALLRSESLYSKVYILVALHLFEIKIPLLLLYIFEYLYSLLIATVHLQYRLERNYY